MISIKVDSRILYSPMAASFFTCVDHTPHWNQSAKINEVQTLCDTFVMDFLFEFGQDDFSGQMLRMMEE